jgi:putative endonuclease
VKQPAVYILANRRNGTLYTGVTSDLLQRVWQHKEKLVAGFTAKYGIRMLVYYELHADMEGAICREKQIKHWRRSWKIKLLESQNQAWRDLYHELLS